MSAAQHKTFRLGQRKAAATPTAEQLAAINAFTLRDFTPEALQQVSPGTKHLFDQAFIGVLVRRLHAAHEALAHPRRIL